MYLKAQIASHQLHDLCVVITLVLSSKVKCISWTAWPMKMGLIGHPKVSVTNYQPTLHNVPEERGPQLHHDRNLKSHITQTFSTHLLSSCSPSFCLSSTPTNYHLYSGLHSVCTFFSVYVFRLLLLLMDVRYLLWVQWEQVADLGSYYTWTFFSQPNILCSLTNSWGLFTKSQSHFCLSYPSDDTDFRQSL